MAQHGKPDPVRINRAPVLTLWTAIETRRGFKALGSSRSMRTASRSTVPLDEFYRIAFRKKVYRSIENLQANLDI